MNSRQPNTLVNFFSGILTKGCASNTKVRMTHKQEKKSAGHFSEAEIRNQMLKQKAILLEFSVERPKEKISDKAFLAWKSIEKKGFFVTTTGCLLPAKNNLTKETADNVATEFFLGKKPNLSVWQNEDGWPMQEKISRLCHQNSCCSYKDLVIEAQWKNSKRNYCGAKGFCDCGSDPPCKAKFFSGTEEKDFTVLSYSTPNLGDRVREFFECDTEEIRVKVKILPADYYKVQDKKRENRNRRINAMKRQKKQRLRKEKWKRRKLDSEKKRL